MAAPGPWGEPGAYPPYSRARPHSPSAPTRVHPYAAPGVHPYAAPDVQRHSYYGQAMQSPPIPGFYSPALAQPRPGTPPTMGSPPAFPQPRIGLPPSLVPGRKPNFAVSRSQSNDYFFQNDPAADFHIPPRHAQTAPVPPLPRKPDFDQPPLPPKPSSPTATALPTSPPLPNGAALYASPEPSPLPSAPPLPPSQQHEEDDAIFNRVLEMSAQESRSQSHGEPMLSEEEQLARALEESLKMSSANFSVSSPDRQHSIMTSSPEQGPSAPSRHSIPDLDLAVASSSHRASQRVSGGGFRAEQISADEALARQLAEEEERLLQEEEEERRRSSTSPPSQPPAPIPAPAHSPANAAPSEPDSLPQYEDAVSSPPSVASPPASSFYNSSLTAHLPVAANGAGPSRPGSPSRMSSLNRSISDKPIPPRNSVSPMDRPLGRSQSCGESSPVSAGTALMAPTLSAASSTSDLQEDKDSESQGSGVEIVPNTQYVDAELLAGLAMNFGTPPISPSLKPFAGVIPNVIALPYGRTLPFYIKAPSWRNMLRLMARLSGTRLEPTMEAMAVVKTDMRLRVVVSFVKVHHASSDWHTVLYITIDHPIPPNAPTGWKYKNGDTSTLPWSYTLSQLPAFLRDGADSPLSKFYTIPSTNELPFPVLPISFPNLATYLATALETARDAMHDSSSGVRRLAKYIDQFYPNDRPTLDDAPERSGMRQRLKNLVGMGSKPQRDRNADVYELVTPFVPDDFGR